MNWSQLTSLFRVEERSVAFVSASVANILVTVGATLLLVVVLDKGPIGVIVGNFAGTLAVYSVLVFYRREQLGLEFDRKLLREMNRFGIPLVPSALFLWVTNFSDRLFLVKLADTHEVGLYSVGVRIASAMVLLLTAFRMAWPAFAYSIEDDGEARRTYSFVLTYLVARRDLDGDDARAPLAVDRALDRCAGVRGVVARRRPARVLDGRIRRLHRRRDRRRPRAAHAVQLGGHGRRGGRSTSALNFLLIPPYGMMGAAIATIAAYTTMFVGMSWWSQQIYRVPYQWRRVATAVAVGVAPRRGREVRRRRPARRGAVLARVPARPAPARLLPPGRAESDRRAAPSRPLAQTTIR